MPGRFTDPQAPRLRDPRFRGYFATTTAAMTALASTTQIAGDTILITRTVAIDPDHLWVCITGGTASIANWRDTTNVVDTYQYGNTYNAGSQLVVTGAGTIYTSTPDLTAGSIWRFDIAGSASNVFVFPTPPTAVCSFVLMVGQDVTGSRLATWPTTVRWQGGIMPTLSTVGLRVDILSFFTVDSGANWHGFIDSIGSR